MTPMIRVMTDDDCAAVAEVRVRSWQYAYAGLVPQPYLDSMDVEQATDRLRGHFTAGAGTVTHLVAERNGAVVGWGCAGPGRDPDAAPGEAELYALYALPAHLSTGVGRALLAELVAGAEAAGHRAMRLWVLKGNARARRFYERAGFLPDGCEEPFEVGGAEVPEVRYARGLEAPRPSTGPVDIASAADQRRAPGSYSYTGRPAIALVRKGRPPSSIRTTPRRPGLLHSSSRYQSQSQFAAFAVTSSTSGSRTDTR
ncbi:GNAT family N-acetyltransferase [Streptomyces qinzhouensis]|uniref:GNAT family N-acetyltransferase n=1 Tax=Streptomyces qinzhouensis TaxID=2599401 RepID=UPI00319D9D69